MVQSHDADDESRNSQVSNVINGTVLGSVTQAHTVHFGLQFGHEPLQEAKEQPPWPQREDQA